MPIDFMKVYSAKTVINDIKRDMDTLSSTLNEIESALSVMRSQVRGERRLMVRGGGGYYEYIRVTYFNYTIDVHVVPPIFELNELISGIRDRLRAVLKALNESLSVLERLSGVENLSLVGVMIEDGKTKLLLIP